MANARPGAARHLPGREPRDPVRVKATGEPGTKEFVLEIIAEVPRHHLEPDQAVGGPPRFGLVPEHHELQRKQPGSGLQIGVHTGGIGLVDRPRLGRKHREVTLGDPIDAQRPEEPVRIEGTVAEDLGEPRRTDPTLHFHLPEPILCVDEAHREGAVPRRLCIDVRDCMGIADNLHGSVEPGHALGAVIRRQ